VARCSTICAGAREKPGKFLGFRRDRDATQVPVRQIDCQFLDVVAIRFDSLVGGHRDIRRIDHKVGDPCR
jgi:hypothetical protein